MFEDDFETQEFREFVADMKGLPSIKTAFVYRDITSTEGYASLREDGTMISPQKIMVFGETKEITETMLMKRCNKLMEDARFVWVRQLPYVEALNDWDERRVNGYMEFVGRARIAVL